MALLLLLWATSTSFLNFSNINVVNLEVVYALKKNILNVYHRVWMVLGGGIYRSCIMESFLFLKALCVKEVSFGLIDALTPCKVQSLVRNPFDVNILLWPYNHLVENWKKP